MAARTQWTLTTTTFPELDEERGVAERIRAQRPDFASASNLTLIAWARAVAPLQRLLWRAYSIASGQAATGPAVVSSLIGGGRSDADGEDRRFGRRRRLRAAVLRAMGLSRTVRADAALLARPSTRASTGCASGCTPSTASSPSASRSSCTITATAARANGTSGSRRGRPSPSCRSALIDRLRQPRGQGLAGPAAGGAHCRVRRRAAAGAGDPGRQRGGGGDPAHGDRLGTPVRRLAGARQDECGDGAQRGAGRRCSSWVGGWSPPASSIIPARCSWRSSRSWTSSALTAAQLRRDAAASASGVAQALRPRTADVGGRRRADAAAGGRSRARAAATPADRAAGRRAGGRAGVGRHRPGARAGGPRHVADRGVRARRDPGRPADRPVLDPAVHGGRPASSWTSGPWAATR